MPDELGPTAEGADPYERNNLWMLEAASQFGADKVGFICLWNGSKATDPAARASPARPPTRPRRPGSRL